MKKSFRICIASNTNMSIGHEPLGEQKVDFLRGFPLLNTIRKNLDLICLVALRSGI
jgi:hypothetical protein